MTSRDQTQRLLETLIFTGDRAEDWVQDVWALSPTLGESAASLVDVFNTMLDVLSEDQQKALMQQLYQDHSDLIRDTGLIEHWQHLLES